ncbi:cob(I)yrinic acid a,c-diamide adenosyltransferase [Ruminococcaceae bacterium OttesenSCG-928-I18]|nr:cob(I)yrinic acid a,c-diamide adenosyltransferase [Ruminococcaceae bacterium OttesenSCG-928-I18]
MSKGFVHVYYGDGKGKTTAAIGLAVRAAGCGRNVLIVQFLKGRPSGEVRVLQGISGITLLRDDENGKFSWTMTDSEQQQARRRNNEMLETAGQKARQAECDLLVLDEALGACSAELLDAQALLCFLRDKPEDLEVVLTGRDPSKELLSLADYATEMRKEKHPYDKGIEAREGVEF